MPEKCGVFDLNSSIIYTYRKSTFYGLIRFGTTGYYLEQRALIERGRLTSLRAGIAVSIDRYNYDYEALITYSRFGYGSLEPEVNHPELAGILKEL